MAQECLSGNSCVVVALWTFAFGGATCVKCRDDVCNVFRFLMQLCATGGKLHPTSMSQCHFSACLMCIDKYLCDVVKICISFLIRVIWGSCRLSGHLPGCSSGHILQVFQNVSME